MPTVFPITERIAGCISNFLVDHHRAPIETKVDVARIRWSSCQHENKIYLKHAYAMMLSAI